MGQGQNKNECCFCGKFAQYSFTMNTVVCGHHWNMLYDLDVPDHIPDSQKLNFKAMILKKKIKIGKV